MTTPEGNKIIAEFMGFIPEKSELGNTYRHPDKMGVYGGVGMKFQYHQSWDWLMPVLQKMNRYQNIETMLKVGAVKRELLTLDIEKTFNAVVDFITWYNTQSK